MALARFIEWTDVHGYSYTIEGDETGRIDRIIGGKRRVVQDRDLFSDEELDDMRVALATNPAPVTP